MNFLSNAYDVMPYRSSKNEGQGPIYSCAMVVDFPLPTNQFHGKHHNNHVPCGWDAKRDSKRLLMELATNLRFRQ